MTRLPLFLAFLASICPIAPAQTTYVVDINGGPGSNFTSLGAALAVAAHGDTVIVRRGAYAEPGAGTDQGIRLVGEPGASIVSSFSIDRVPAGETMTMRGFDLAPAGTLSIADNLGQVHVEDVDLSPSAGSDEGWLSVVNNAQVSLTRVAVSGYRSSTVRSSRASLVSCTLRNVPRSGMPAPALHLDSSTVSIVGGSVSGALTSSPTPPPGMTVTGGHAILAGRRTTISAGLNLSSATPVPAISSAGGSIEWDPAVTLIARNGAPPISGGTVVQREISSVVADGLANGGTWKIELHAPRGSLACLLAATPIPATATAFGDLWINPSASLVLGCATLGPGRVWSLQFSLRSGLPRGAPIAMQAAVATGPVLALSTAAVSIVE